ncbi:PREDICTED: neuronal acetylcholine receptor subunit alpha-10-like, partial [Tinamus guttatus]|uniref:neuronal acetylcholine receptor subunit alpha-10-like n=1 Tax=Tinamus guttatus TaxID=94827 RepID=UPI00052ECCF1
ADEQRSGPTDTNVVLRSDGRIVWDAPAITKSSCKVDVSFFPFDGQQCRLTFGSWTYDGNQVDLRHRLEAGDLTDFVENVEWEVLGMPATRNVVTYGCMPPAESVPLIGKYYIATMTMITASTALTIFVMSIHHCGPGARPVPRWARRLILHYMARVFLVYEVGESCKGPHRANTEEPGGTGNGTGRAEERAGARGCTCPHGSLLSSVGYIAGCFREQRAAQRRASDWKRVAKVMDRFFMWVFFVMVFLMSALIVGKAV